MTHMQPKVCLVSMPFMSITMPGLGVSTLKSMLADVGVKADIYYGALDFFRFFAVNQSPAQALFDYNFLATNGDLGDVFFSAVLWDGSVSPIREAMDEILVSPNPLLRKVEMQLMVARLLSYVEQAPAFIRFCFNSRDWAQYDIIGFSSTFCQNVSSLALARLIRTHHPDLHIVFGGANCEGDMGTQLLRSFPWVDTVIQGEADFTFPEFVRHYCAGQSTRDIPGVVSRDGDVICVATPPMPVQTMDALPHPDFGDYFAQLPEQLTRAGEPIFLPIETSRGCWWGAVSHCTFCGLNPTTMRFRSKSPERVIQEFRRMRTMYGQRNFYAVDNIISMKYFTEVLPQLESDDLQIFYETKANLKEEQVRQFARAGVTSIQPGIEGLSTELLELMKKGVKGYQNIELLKWCATYHVLPVWFYLYRFPYEPHEPYWRDIQLFERLVHLPPPRNPNPVVVDRYSPLFQRQHEFGLTNLRPTSRSRICYQGLSEAERFNISYHFEADLPQGKALPYELPLWQAIMDWNYQYARGAHFFQFQTGQTTLLVDTRRAVRKCYLLTGTGHYIHRLLRRAQRDEQIAHEYHLWGTATTAEDFTLADLFLAHIAGELGAEAIVAPEDEADLGRFLVDLEQRWIALPIDGRWIGLAVDCTRVEEAMPYGLTAYASLSSGPNPYEAVVRNSGGEERSELEGTFKLEVR